MKKFKEIEVFQNLDYKEEDPVFIDVGAHIGKSSIPFAKKGWRLVAFEPEPSNFKELIQNTREFPKITCIQKAIWTESRKGASFFRSTEHWGIHSLRASHKTHTDQIEVETVRLDEILNELGLDHVTVLKVDAEGADFPVLQSFDFERYSPAIVFCEFMDSRSVPTFGYSHHDVVKYVKGFGYKAYVSEWTPIQEYGRKGSKTPTAEFVRCLPYPLDGDPSWGNLIFVTENLAPEFETALADYIYRVDEINRRRSSGGGPSGERSMIRSIVKKIPGSVPVYRWLRKFFRIE